MGFFFALKIPYQKFPQVSSVSYRAVLGVYIALPQKNSIRSKKIEAIIDSGATHCIFHAQIGKNIGFDIDKGKQENTYGVDGKPSVLYFHDIHLYAPGGVIPIKAGFSYDLPIAGLLGMNGFFEHFQITFNPAGMYCELERLYQA